MPSTPAVSPSLESVDKWWERDLRHRRAQLAEWDKLTLKQRESDGTFERQVTDKPEPAKRGVDFPVMEPLIDVYVPIYDAKVLHPTGLGPDECYEQKMYERALQNYEIQKADASRFYKTYIPKLVEFDAHRGNARLEEQFTHLEKSRKPINSRMQEAELALILKANGIDRQVDPKLLGTIAKLEADISRANRETLGLPVPEPIEGISDEIQITPFGPPVAGSYITEMLHARMENRPLSAALTREVQEAQRSRAVVPTRVDTPRPVAVAPLALTRAPRHVRFAQPLERHCEAQDRPKAVGDGRHAADSEAESEEDEGLMMRRVV